MIDRSTQIRAMASEVRLEVLRLLREPGKHFGGQWSADPVEFGVCMTLLAEALSLSQPTMSRHLDHALALKLGERTGHGLDGQP